MTKHIVMWKLKEEALGNTKIENALKIKESLEILKDELGEIEDLEVGINICNSDAAYDVVLYSTFKDDEALNDYQVHPKHEAIKEFVGQVTEARAVVDYNI